MTAYIHRSALEFHGLEPSPDVALVICDHSGRTTRTWADVMRERRERQARRLEDLRWHATVRPWQVWVAYYDQWLMGGWQAFIERPENRVWIDRDRRALQSELMALFPMQRGLFTDRDDWQDWKQDFAVRFRASSHHGRPRGRAVVWWDGHNHPVRLMPPRIVV